MSDSLALIGMGASNISLWAEFTDQVKAVTTVGEPKGDEPRKKIYLIDPDFMGGKGWGTHAHPSMLFSHPIGKLKDGFVEWLHANEKTWLPKVEEHRDGALKTWFEQNQAKLDAKQYDEVYVPRFVYGMFKREKLYDALQDLPHCLDVTVLQGKVSNVTIKGKKDEITFEEPAREITLVKAKDGSIAEKEVKDAKAHKRISVDSNVIGIGPVEAKMYAKMRGDEDYFANSISLHPKGKGANFGEQFKNRVLEKYKETGRKVEVGIMGAGLSFLDIVNLVHNDEAVKNAVHLTSICSTGYHSGERNGGKEKQREMAPESLTALERSDVRFVAARVEDVDRVKGKGVVVTTSDKHLDEEGAECKPGTRVAEREMAFDMVVNALGFGKWQDVRMLKGLIKDDVLQERPGSDEPFVDPALCPTKRKEGEHLHGVMVRGQIQANMKEKGMEDGYFLNEIHFNSVNLAAQLVDEVFGKEKGEACVKLKGALAERPTVEAGAKTADKERKK